MKHALIVDDRADNIERLRTLLQALGWTVDEARQGDAALALAHRRPPDLILSDLFLPRLDGGTFLRLCRSDDRLNRTPVIAYAADGAEPRHEQIALELGADLFIDAEAGSAAFATRLAAALDSLPLRQFAGGESTLPAETPEERIHRLTERVRRLERANHELTARQAHLNALFETNPECVTHLAGDGSLLAINAAGLRLIEADTLAEVAGWSFYPLVGEAQRPAFRELTELALRGHAGTLEFEIKGLRGGLRWVETQATPLRDGHGAITGVLGVTRDITARRAAEEARRESEERFRSMVEDAPIGIVLGRADGGVEFMNPAMRCMTGLTAEQGQGAGWLAALHPEDRERMATEWAAAVERGEDYQGSGRYLHADGTVVWWEARTKAIRVGPTVRGHLGMVVDITERRQAEERLRWLSRTQAMMKEIAQLILRIREARPILEGACRIAVERGGFLMAWIALAETPGGRLELAAHAGAAPDTVAMITRLLADPRAGNVVTAQALESREPAVCNDIAHDPRATPWREAAAEHGYGSMVSLPLRTAGQTLGVLNLYAGQPGFFDDEELELLDDMAQEIAFALEFGRKEEERRVALAELRASEEIFRELTEAMREVFWIADPVLNQTLYVSPAYETIWGRARQSLQADPPGWLDTIHPDDRERVRAARAAHEREGVYDQEYRIVRQDGEVRWIHDEAFLIRDTAGAVGRVVGVARDITERRRAQDAVRHNVERFRLLIEKGSDLITVINSLGIIRFQSPSAEPVLGCPPADMIGRSILEFLHPDDVSRAAHVFAQAILGVGAPVSVEFRMRRADGQWRTLEAIGRSVLDESPDGFIILNSRDITESRLLEAQFRQSQKMEAIGQLAGGVAHDFNNILTVIMMQADRVMSLDGLPTEVRDGVEGIRLAADKAGGLTRQLLLFGRRQVMQAHDLNLNDVVRSVAGMLQRMIGEQIPLELRLHPAPLITCADAAMLDQVLLNLAVNARDAMPEGGRIEIETAEVVVTQEQAKQGGNGDAAPGRYVRLTFGDTGTGIPPELQARIFDPFFTTKPPGKGSGLGLATVFGIVKQHRGWIELQSAPGQGARFMVYLPACPPAGAAEGAPVG